MKPQALILRSAGANCDHETAYAFERAGAISVPVHMNRLLEKPAALRDFQILAIPGGFSYGDDIAAGKILARQLSHHLYEPLRDFVAAGKPIIGICNGFQVLVKTDLLPGPIMRRSGNGRSGQLCTLTNNDCGRFVDRWIHLNPLSQKCIWTAGLEPLDLPVAHGEGKFTFADDDVRQAIKQNDQIALIYAKPNGLPALAEFPDNPNGSADDVAGICDESGLTFGLMPHPERYLEAFQHPSRTSQLFENAEVNAGAGLHIFHRGVAHAAAAVGTGV
ncbi:MAG: phosphoribosylformylglycinamidine synthase I [Anaerolineae bacterium]|nr:phosphoribosylformylglycinamidine synthase I [Phycisphaerae bacterium]